MNEIILKTYELIDVMDKSSLIMDIDKYKKRIAADKGLVDLIALGNSTEDEYLLLDIKKKLYNNYDYKMYMESYNKLLYLVMDINSRYKVLLNNGKKGCFK